MENSNNKKDPLSETFNTEPFINTTIELISSNTEVVNVNLEKEYDADYDFTRNSVKNLIMDMEDKLQALGSLAMQGQEARAYEVFAILAKTILDGNKDLLEVSRKHKDLKENDKTVEPNQVNNNLFITTGALHEILEKNGIETGIRTISKN